MQGFVVLAYDILTALVFVYMIAVSARRGLARTLAYFLGYAAILFGAAAVSGPAAQWAFEALLRPGIVSSISGKLSQAQAELLPESLLAFAESVPSGVLEMLGFDPEELAEMLHRLIEGGGAGAAAAITDSVIAPLATHLIKLVLFLLVFSIGMFFLRRLVGIFDEVNHLPLIGPVNQVLGGVVGAAQAALTMFIIAAVLKMLLSLVPGGITIPVGGQPLALCNEALLRETLFFKVFLQTNPLDLLLFAQDAGWLPQLREPSNNALAVSGLPA